MGCCCADGDWLYVLWSSEQLAQCAAAVGRGRGPLGHGTVVFVEGEIRGGSLFKIILF